MSAAQTRQSKNLAVESRRAFAAWVNDAPEGRTFAQVRAQRTDTSGYRLCHVDDREVADSTLYEEPRDARQISKLTETGEYRPLKSAPNLKRGWLLRLNDERELATAMNYLYPAAVVHWYLYREGELEITHYRENAGRQSGIYKRVQALTDDAVQEAARACCEDAVCLKKTLWDVEEDLPLRMDRGQGEIPCPEPCSLFVSFARRVRLFEREQKRDLDAAGLSPSEKEDLTALVEAAATGAVEFAREAEFEESLNERRMRYRKLTLVPKLNALGQGEDGQGAEA
ncbi:hypothetical protein BH23ACT11_BH23ACT11_07350 [soil metagenome]